MAETRGLRSVEKIDEDLDYERMRLRRCLLEETRDKVRARIDRLLDERSEASTLTALES